MTDLDARATFEHACRRIIGTLHQSPRITNGQRLKAANAAWSGLHEAADKLVAAEVQHTRAALLRIQDEKITAEVNRTHALDELAAAKRMVDSLRDELTEARAARARKVPPWSEKAVEPQPVPPATAEPATERARTAAKPRTGRPAGTGKARTAQSRTEPQGGAKP